MTKKLKILQLGSTAGVGSSLSALLKENFPYKVKSSYIARSDQDYYRFNDHYKKSGNGVIIAGQRAFWFYLYIGFYILIRKPDVIQIHAWLKGVWMVNILRKFYLSKKPYIIYHGHGTEIRGKTIDDLPELRNVDKIIVSTKDIMIKGVNSEYIPNPIDKELFFFPENDNKNSKNSKNNRENRVLFIRNFSPIIYPYDYMDKVTQFADDNNLELTVIDRMSDHDTTLPFPPALTFGDFIPFTEMGGMFRQFKYFLDFKGYEPVFSKASIEASRCGCIVVQESLTEYSPADLDQYDGYDNFVDYYVTLIAELL